MGDPLHPISVHSASSFLEIIIRMISLVPSRILCTLRSLTYFSMPVSVRYPYPPCICKAQSTISWHLSVALCLAIAQYRVLLESSESIIEAALLTSSLEETRSVAMSENLNCRYCISVSFLPNCFRLCIQILAASRQKEAPPKLQLAILTLPPSRAFIAILNPMPSLPTRFLAGILTSSKLTRQVGWIFQPILSSIFPKLSPFAPFSTIKTEISVCEVLAITKQMSENSPPEMNILDPFRTYSSPSFLAVVFIALASDPLSGSVKQQLENMSRLTIAGPYFFFCSSLPNSSRIQRHMLWMVKYVVTGTSPVERASKMTEASSRESPVPIWWYTAAQPISAASFMTSTGKCLCFSHSSEKGASFCLANSSACDFIWKRSSPRAPLSSKCSTPSKTCLQSAAPQCSLWSNCLVFLAAMLSMSIIRDEYYYG